jgi:hypothetical protein
VLFSYLPADSAIFPMEIGKETQWRHERAGPDTQAWIWIHAVIMRG